MDNSELNVFLMVGAIFAFIGLIFLIIGLVFMHLHKKKKNLCTARTVGQVVDIVSRTSTDSDGYSSVAYSPVISYWVNGIEVRQTNSVYSRPCRYTVGQNVEVMYDPMEPGKMLVAGDKSETLLFGIFTGLGGLFFILGIVFIIVGIR